MIMPTTKLDQYKEITPEELERLKKEKGTNNPLGKGGFGDNPQNINMNGRPKNEESPSYWLRKYLSEIDPKTVDGKIRLQQLAERLAIEAFKGESWAMKEVFDRLDGKAPQTIKHDGQVQVGSKEVASLLQKIIQDDTETENSDSDGS